MSRKALLLILAIPALIALCLLLVAAAGSVRIPLAKEYANTYLHDRYPFHDVDFDAALLSWQAGAWLVDLHLEKVTLSDAAGDVVASVPALVVALEPLSLLRGDPRPRTILLDRPVIRLERTSGGALKIDIGTTQDGASGSVGLMMLTDLAASGAGPASEIPPPGFAVDEAELLLVDERSGARFGFAPASLVLRQVEQGVRADAVLGAVTSGERLEVELMAVFRTSDRSVWIDAEFSNANPAILSDLLPNLRALGPVEVALNGHATAVLNGDLTLRAAEMALRGGPGSLEIAPYTGRNVALNSLRAAVTYAQGGGQLEIRDLMLDLQGRQLTGSLSSVAAQEQDHRVISGDLTLGHASWSDILPVWFAALEFLETSERFAAGREGTLQRLRFETLLDTATGDLEGGGNLSYVPSLPGAMQDPSGADPMGLQVFVGGTLGAPEITFGAP